MNKVISSDLAKAIELWRDLTKVSSSDMRLSKWHLSQTFQELDESIHLDPTEITTNLLLTSFLNGYLKNSSVSLYDLLMESPSVSSDLKKTRDILAIIQNPEIIEVRDHFIGTLKKAMDTYGATDRADVSELLNTYDRVAVLRRDALRSITKLKFNQFISGAHDPETIRPSYTRMVNRWKNVNSLIAALPHMPSGVSLNLISPPNDPMRSFFCFGIRNGGNIFILSDAPEDAHPLKRYMTRRPDRTLDSRISKNWFPYELLDLVYDEKDNLHVRDSIEGLIPYHRDAYSIKAISDLEPDCFAWTSMMFDLIVEKFWRKTYTAPELSYTTEMLQTHAHFINCTENANLPTSTYNPLGLKPLTIQDVTTENLTVADLGRKGSGKNKWLEERYGHLVPEAALNAIADANRHLLLDSRAGQVTESDKAPERSHSLFNEQKYKPFELNTVDPCDFGSREQIEADRKFIARSNFAKCVSQHARDEYETRKNEVHAWYQNKVKENIFNLIALIGNKQLWIDGGIGGAFSGYETGAGSVHTYSLSTGLGSPQHIYHSLLKVYDYTDKENAHSLWSTNIRFGASNAQGYHTCHLNGSKASYFALFTPANSDELAFIAGCKVEDLPDVLQHWNLHRPYEGNSILDRIDPLEWAATNPWLKLHLSVAIFLSKRALATLNKYESLTPNIPGLITDLPWKDNPYA
jgi:hypothetical protein